MVRRLRQCRIQGHHSRSSRGADQWPHHLAKRSWRHAVKHDRAPQTAGHFCCQPICAQPWQMPYANHARYGSVQQQALSHFCHIQMRAPRNGIVRAQGITQHAFCLQRLPHNGQQQILQKQPRRYHRARNATGLHLAHQGGNGTCGWQLQRRARRIHHAPAGRNHHAPRSGPCTSLRNVARIVHALLFGSQGQMHEHAVCTPVGRNQRLDRSIVNRHSRYAHWLLRRRSGVAHGSHRWQACAHEPLQQRRALRARSAMNDECHIRNSFLFACRRWSLDGVGCASVTSNALLESSVKKWQNVAQKFRLAG